MLQSVTGSVVFRGSRQQTGHAQSEVIKQRKTQVGNRFERVENSCKKKENNRKKRYFYLTNALNCGIIYIALIGEGRKPCTIKKEARGNPLKLNPPLNYGQSSLKGLPSGAMR